MPYIPNDERILLDIQSRRIPSSVGQLNFVISDLLDDWMTDRGISYASINDVMGVLSSVQAEFYRRVAVPYEEKKRSENGEVYHCV